MANEAVIIELLGNGGDPVRYTVPDNVAIEKGTLLWMVDPRTVSGALVTGNDGPKPFAGIAAAEKVAGDGATTIPVYTNGIFDLKTTGGTMGTVNTGDLLILSGQNLVTGLSGAHAGGASGANSVLLNKIRMGAVVGKALEDGSSAEVIAVRIGGGL